MLKINEHYLKLQASYLFSDIAKRVANFQEQHPDKDVIKLGIGDVTKPLPEACIRAFHKAVDEMAVVMKDIAERSILYYFSKYHENH